MDDFQEWADNLGTPAACPERMLSELCGSVYESSQEYITLIRVILRLQYLKLIVEACMAETLVLAKSCDAILAD